MHCTAEQCCIGLEGWVPSKVGAEELFGVGGVTVEGTCPRGSLRVGEEHQLKRAEAETSTGWQIISEINFKF